MQSRTTTEKPVNTEQSQKVATFSGEDHTDKGDGGEGGVSDWEEKDKNEA